MPQDFSLDRLLAGRRWGDTIEASVRSGGRFLSSSYFFRLPFKMEASG